MNDPNRPVTGYPTTTPPPPATAYPHFTNNPNNFNNPNNLNNPNNQNPFFISNPNNQNPYFNNNPYNYPNNYQNPQRITFLRRLIALIIASTVITGTILFIIWLVIRPKIPAFRVDSLHVSSLNLSTSSLITATWDLHVTAKNPNSKITLYYDEIAAAIYYDSLSLSDTRVPPFVMGRGNETGVEASFVALGAYVEKWAFDGMSRQISEKGNVGFNVRMVARVRFKAGAWRARSRYLRVYCGDLNVGVVGNKSSNKSLSGSLIGGPRECVVAL